MINLDKMKQKKEEIQTALCEAIKEQNESKITEALNKYSECIAEAISGEALTGTSAYVDSGILSARGIRQLTQKETDYYNKVIAASKSSDPKQAISNINETIPETIIESVFQDIKKNHLLLELVDFRNTSGIAKIIYDKSGITEAVWGDIGASSGAVVSGALGVLSTQLYKIMGFIFVPNDVIDLGAQWIDRYIRELLIEYIAGGLENAIVYGDGNKKPIGMARSVADDVTVTAGVYPLKTKIELNKITATSLGEILAKIAKAPGSTSEKPIPRPVTDIVLIVNPFDYFQKIMPATTVRSTDGRYINDVMPYPCKIVQSAALPANSAIIGMAKRYLCAVGFSKDPKLEVDDSVKFDEDCRAYRVKLLATGQPLDDNAFQLLDITKLTAENLQVEITNTAENPVNTKEIAAG